MSLLLRIYNSSNDAINTAHAYCRRLLALAILWSVYLGLRWYLWLFLTLGYSVTIVRETNTQFLNHGWLVVGNRCSRRLRSSQIVRVESDRLEGRAEETQSGHCGHQKRPVRAAEKGIRKNVLQHEAQGYIRRLLLENVVVWKCVWTLCS